MPIITACRVGISAGYSRVQVELELTCASNNNPATLPIYKTSVGSAPASEAGLLQMVGRNKLDMMWLGAGPGERLFTICNCCPCCCLWKMLPALNPRISVKVNRLPGVSVTVTDLCKGCETCLDGICFVDAIEFLDGRAQIGPECRGCGRCVEVCPNGAIELPIQESSYIDQAIQRLSLKVDLR